jgi:hypothetical protein
MKMWKERTKIRFKNNRQGMNRDSFIFYKSWYEAIKSFPAEVKGEIYTVIMEYGLYGNETHDMGKIAGAIWTLIRPQMDANRARYENGCKGGEYGSLGGAPKGNKNASKKQPRNNPKTTPNENDDEYVNENVNENEAVFSRDGIFESVESLKSRLKSTSWLEQAGMKLKIAPDALLQKFDEFTDELMLKGDVSKTEKDFKSHFINWINLKKDKSKQQTEYHGKKYENLSR